MWKLNESMLEGNEERGDGLLDDESDGFCSLSPMQVLRESPKFQGQTFVLVFRFSEIMLLFGFDYTESLWVCCLFGRWFGLYDPGMSIHSPFLLLFSCIGA